MTKYNYTALYGGHTITRRSERLYTHAVAYAWTNAKGETSIFSILFFESLRAAQLKKAMLPGDIIEVTRGAACE